MKELILPFAKYLFAAAGAILGFLKPTFPFALICLLAVALDCYSAYALSKRIKKKYPEAADGKFKSKYAYRVFHTLFKVYALILLVYLIDRIVIPADSSCYLPNIVAGMFAFVQIWSFLENESSENDAKWAKLLQRFMVNKAERHFDFPLRDLLNDSDSDNDNNNNNIS